MSSTEIRHHVRPMYPGSFFPEEGSSVRIDEDTDVAALARYLDDDQWFCIEVTTAQWRRWTSDGMEKWMVDADQQATRRRIYVGDRLAVDDIEALDGQHDILLANMRGNGWDHVVRTRRGNFQSIEGDDVVYTAEELAALAGARDGASA